MRRSKPWWAARAIRSLSARWVATAKDDSGSVMIQIVEAHNLNPISGAPSFRELPDVGERGYVANDVGWTAKLDHSAIGLPLA